MSPPLLFVPTLAQRTLCFVEQTLHISPASIPASICYSPTVPQFHLLGLANSFSRSYRSLCRVTLFPMTVSTLLYYPLRDFVEWYASPHSQLPLSPSYTSTSQFNVASSRPTTIFRLYLSCPLTLHHCPQYVLHTHCHRMPTT